MHAISRPKTNNILHLYSVNKMYLKCRKKNNCLSFLIVQKVGISEIFYLFINSKMHAIYLDFQKCMLLADPKLLNCTFLYYQSFYIFQRANHKYIIP